jgi:hypothetical protein
MTSVSAAIRLLRTKLQIPQREYIMADAQVIPDIGWENIIKEFFALIIKTPVALFALVASFLMGYGISFVLFDYRSSSVNKSHYILHIFLGVGYAALIFLGLNWDIVNRDITPEIITSRIPITLIVSLAFGFLVIFVWSIIKEVRSPIASEEEL